MFTCLINITPLDPLRGHQSITGHHLLFNCQRNETSMRIISCSYWQPLNQRIKTY